MIGNSHPRVVCNITCFFVSQNVYFDNTNSKHHVTLVTSSSNSVVLMSFILLLGRDVYSQLAKDIASLGQRFSQGKLINSNNARQRGYFFCARKFKQILQALNGNSRVMVLNSNCFPGVFSFT